jgi:hypothetical protein
MSGQRHDPASLYPRERPSTHCTGGWLGLRASLDRCGKSRPHQDSITRPSSPWAYSMYYIKRKLCQIIQQKDANFWLSPSFFLLVHVFMLQYRRGKKISSDQIISKKVYFQLRYTDYTHKHTHTFTYPSICTSQTECGIHHPHSIRLVQMMDMWMCVCVCYCSK